MYKCFFSFNSVSASLFLTFWFFLQFSFASISRTSDNPILTPLSYALPFIVVTIVYYILKSDGNDLASIPFANVQVKYLLKSLGYWFIYIVFAIGSIYLIYIFNPELFERYFKDLYVQQYIEKLLEKNYFLAITTIAILPGILEEFLFRGIILQNFLKVMKPAEAIILTSLLFSVVHMEVVRIFYTFLLGLTLAYTAYKYNSIKYPMILHIVNNLITILCYRL